MSEKLKPNRAWEQRNRRKTTIDTYKRTARMFINKHADLEDLEELEELISTREKHLKGDDSNDYITFYWKITNRI